MFGHKSEEIELPQHNEEDNEQKNQIEDNEAGNKNKDNALIIIIVVIGVLVLGVIIFIVIFFSSKKGRNGGYISVVHELDLNDNITIFNVGNLKSDEYEIEVLNNAVSIRSLQEEYSTKNGVFKYNDNKERVGTIKFKITFKTVLTKMDTMFKDIKSLIEADLSEFVSEKVKSMNSLFLNCEKLVNVNFTNFDSKKVESMDNTFENCINLVELDLKSFQTPKLKSLKSTFNNCSKLEYLDLSNFELKEKIVDREGIFNNTKSLQYMRVEDEETNNLLSSLSPNYINCTSELICKERENEECLKCNNNKCISCYNGYYLPNYITYVPKCKKCYEKCEQCNDYMNCTKCKNETSYDLTDGHCILKKIITPNITDSIGRIDNIETSILNDFTTQPAEDTSESSEYEESDSA